MSKKETFGNGTGFMRAFKAFFCSVKGLTAAFKHESAFRQELALACLFLPYGVWLGEDLTSKLFLVTLVVLVLVAELLNSAIEAVVDRVGLEHNELSGRAKDLGSAAVMLCLVLTGACYAIVSYHKFFGAA